ncbi:hypothetical protein RyT2_24130 [Pseudolactococcus yaeyamensis]
MIRQSNIALFLFTCSLIVYILEENTPINKGNMDSVDIIKKRPIEFPILEGTIDSSIKIIVTKK